MRVVFLRFMLSLSGMLTWPSWSGFGVTTAWPDKKCCKQIERAAWLFERLLPAEYIVVGPTYATGGALVIYCWRKDDPRVREAIEETETSKSAYR